MERKRQTAIKTRIKPLIAGKFISPGGFNPSFVLTSQGQKISRARLLGTIVDKFASADGKFSSATLDDASSTLRLRVFNSRALEPLEKGDIIDVIGKVREYKAEIYVMPEILRKVDINFELLRELELREAGKNWEEKRKMILSLRKQAADLEEVKAIAKDFSLSSEEVESILHSSEPDETEGEKEKVLELIERYDKGDGCDYSSLLTESGFEEDMLDTIINSLLAEGECFEPKPGKIKRL